MKNKKYLFLLLLAKISLIVYPYRLSMFCRYLRNLVESSRFVSLTNCNGKAFLEVPFTVMGHQYIQFESFSSRPGLRIECWDKYMGQSFKPRIVIGKNVCFNFRCHIGAINEIIIGDNVLIGSNVLITDHGHGTTSKEDTSIPPYQRLLYSKGSVIIEDNVWIGENVCILPNVVIGENSVIAAGSVVVQSMPKNSVVAGVPARVIRIV